MMLPRPTKSPSTPNARDLPAPMSMAGPQLANVDDIGVAWQLRRQHARHIYLREVICALSLRADIKLHAHRYDQRSTVPDGRVVGAICCDYMHWRWAGQTAGNIVSEFFRRAKPNKLGLKRGPNLPRPIATSHPTEQQEAAFNRLYQACHTTLLHTKRNGKLAFPASRESGQPSLRRIANLLIPSSFERDYEAGAGLTCLPHSRIYRDGEPALDATANALDATAAHQRERYLRGIAKIFDAIDFQAEQASAHLIYLRLQIPEAPFEHVVVVDMDAEDPGIFDPNHGFLSLPEHCGQQEYGTLIAKLCYRYDAQSLSAFLHYFR